VRVVVAEDHALLREGLTRILEANGCEVVAAVDNPVSFLRVLAEERPDLAILDVRMPPTFTDEGIVAAQQVRAERPGFPLLVLSQYVEPLYAAELLASGEGSIGYLLKGRVADVQGFVVACRSIAAGGTVLDPEVVAAMISTRRSSPVERLTDREREVLGLMAEGRSNAAIADRLNVTEKAVAKHINNLFAKLDLPPAPDDNRRVLAVLAFLGTTGQRPTPPSRRAAQPSG
jgi:DNA-binding NarL/FixJ family response regulator